MTAKQFRIGLNSLGHTKKLVAVKFAYEKGSYCRNFQPWSKIIIYWIITLQFEHVYKIRRFFNTIWQDSSET